MNDACVMCVLDVQLVLRSHLDRFSTFNLRIRQLFWQRFFYYVYRANQNVRLMMARVIFLLSRLFKNGQKYGPIKEKTVSNSTRVFIKNECEKPSKVRWL